jgi:hypothetical protein
MGRITKKLSALVPGGRDLFRLTRTDPRPEAEVKADVLALAQKHIDSKETS